MAIALCHSYNMKFILSKFAKGHCFWTLWTLNYVDCIPFSYIDFFHLAHNQTKQFRKITISNFQKTWSNLHLCIKGSIKSVFFICPSVCLSVHLRSIFLRIYSVGFFCTRIFAMYTKVTKLDTAWKVSKYGVISGPYFPVYGLNTEIYRVSLRIQSEYTKIKTRKSSIFGHFSCSEIFFNFCDLVRLLIILQSNLSIADMLYCGHLVIADTFLRNQPNYGETLIEKPLCRGHFYIGHLL